MEAFANSFWGTDGHIGALPLMFACTEPRLNGECALRTQVLAHMSGLQGSLTIVSVMFRAAVGIFAHYNRVPGPL